MAEESPFKRYFTLDLILWVKIINSCEDFRIGEEDDTLDGMPQLYQGMFRFRFLPEGLLLDREAHILRIHLMI